MPLPESIFVAAISLITYTYLLYPAGIWLLSQLRPSELPPPLQDADCPEVTAVMAVFNESRRLPTRIANLRALDYPAGKLKIIVVSDGSTDDTLDVGTRIGGPDVRVLSYPERRGKAHAINLAMQSVDTPVVLLCDVRQHSEPPALRMLASTLMQPGVGAVSGELVHRDPKTRVAANIGLYWRYEKMIRRAESRWHAVVGATGAFYAIRHDGFVPLADGTLLDDFEIPMQIARQGKRVLFDGRALVVDDLQDDIEGESIRKMRTLGGNFQSFARHPWLFSPLQNPICVQFISHKAFRLVIPHALIVTLVASVLSSTLWVQATLIPQIAFYLAAWAGLRQPQLRKNKLVAFATVFVELNWIALVAGVRFATGRLDTGWKKT